MAVGLGSMDMPGPSVAAWEWLNWKFPRAVYAGETIYARWTLTQKRAPVGNAPTAIVVWRVDVHTAGGALCAEGEIGASVVRKIGAAKAHVETRVEEPAAGAPSATRRRRGRRRPAAGDGAKSASDVKVAPAADAAAEAAPAKGDGSPSSAAAPERAAGGTRRRRRRRSPSSTQARNGDAPAPASLPAPSAPAEAAAPPARRSAAAGDEAASPLSRVIRRLRRT